jgi:hypothetical protein
MSTTAKDVSTTLGNEPSVDSTDEIAALLAEEAPESEDAEGEEAQAKASNEGESEDESNKEAEGEESELEEIVDGESSWESVLGVSEEKLSFDDNGNVAGVNVKIDGETSTVSVGDLIAGYQTNKSVTQRSQSLAEEKKAFESQKEIAEQTYASKLKTVDALTSHFEKQLISEFDGVDWETLRANDPAEYAAARSDFAAKAGELQNIQRAIKADAEQQSQEATQAQNAQAQGYMKTQFDAMIVKNPTWTDEKVRLEAENSFKTFVNDTYGFTEQEFESVFDARLIELIKDAQKYHDGAKVAAKKKLIPVPKFQKSRGKAKPSASKLDKLTAASKKAQGSEKRDLQASAVAELLSGG